MIRIHRVLIGAKRISGAIWKEGFRRKVIRKDPAIDKSMFPYLIFWLKRTYLLGLLCFAYTFLILDLSCFPVIFYSRHMKIMISKWTNYIGFSETLKQPIFINHYRLQQISVFGTVFVYKILSRISLQSISKS